MHLEPHERFKSARIDYNVNGKETMDQVAKATGIPQSVISDLERDPNKDANHPTAPRKVAYQTVAVLAKHYGVSGHFLLGLTEDHRITPSGVDELGLSFAAVQAIEKIKEIAVQTANSNSRGKNMLSMLDRILSDDDFIFVLLHACEAEAEASKLVSMYKKIEDDAKENLPFAQYRLFLTGNEQQYSFRRFQATQCFTNLLDKACGYETFENVKENVLASVDKIEKEKANGSHTED